MTMGLLEKVRYLKTQAKNRRDDKLYEEGVALAYQAIADLEPAFESAVTDDWKTRFASELADCFGLIGGIQRRWGLSLDDSERAGERKKHLELSIEAYDKGNHYELEKNYDVVNSYNLVNRLVGRILLSPNTDLREEMRKAKDIVSEQLKQKRRGDIWALADKALLQLLLGEIEHDKAWAEFLDHSPPSYAFDSVLDTLDPLAVCDLPIRAELASSIEILQGELEKL